MSQEVNRKSILETAHGAILERADYEMAKIIDNITDANTEPAKKRVLTITLDFIPNETRTAVEVRSRAHSKLEPTMPVKTSLFLTPDGDGQLCAVEMPPQIPGQMGIDGSEQETAAVIKVIR